MLEGGELKRGGESDMDWAQEMRLIQRACQEAADEVAKKHTRPKRAGPQINRKEEMRARIGKWGRIAREARRWNGRLGGRRGWEDTTFAKERMIGRNEGVKEALARGGSVKDAVIKVCDEELKKATEQFEETDTCVGKRLLTEMEETVTEGTGAIVIKIFEALRRATAGGKRADHGMAAITSSTKASGRYWEESTAEGLQAINNPKLRQALRGGKELTEEQWKETGIRDLTMDQTIQVGSKWYRPKKAKTITEAEEVRTEVWEEATRINANKETDIATLRKLLRWIQPETASPETTVEELCTWPACKKAIAKGFKRGKGVGIDGFDGYLIRLLPEQMQYRYWKILRGIATRGAFPSEWNEWIAVLALKPGEDPKNLERRRDLWLQCHTMKCLFRMLLPAYEAASSRLVGVCNAGWTRGRCAPEQTLTARLIAEMRMRESKMNCRGYVDLGCYFMSVVHAVQWEVEKWGGSAARCNKSGKSAPRRREGS